MRQVYAELLEDALGYRIMIKEDDLPAQLALVQPEPHIIYRVTTDDGKTDYQASGDLHASKFLEELEQGDAEQSEQIALEERILALETQQMESEVDIDYRLSLIELGLV